MQRLQLQRSCATRASHHAEGCITMPTAQVCLASALKQCATIRSLTRSKLLQGRSLLHITFAIDENAPEYDRQALEMLCKSLHMVSTTTWRCKQGLGHILMQSLPIQILIAAHSLQIGTEASKRRQISKQKHLVQLVTVVLMTAVQIQQQVPREQH